VGQHGRVSHGDAHGTALLAGLVLGREETAGESERTLALQRRGRYESRQATCRFKEVP